MTLIVRPSAVTGVGEHLAGQIWVVRVGLVKRRVVPGLAFECVLAERELGVAVQRLGNGFTVDSVVQRLTHTHIADRAARSRRLGRSG